MPRMVAFSLFCVMFPTPTFGAVSQSGVQVIAHEGQRRVDVTIDGRPFTSYIWPTTLKKPVSKSRCGNGNSPTIRLSNAKTSSTARAGYGTERFNTCG